MYEIHPIAEIFPRMSDSELASLTADIEQNGLLEPIWIYEGKVIDGRHRFSACAKLGITPLTRNYEGSDPVGFVVSLNLKRRHLNESQRAMVAASLSNMPLGGSVYRSANLQTDIAQVSQSSAATMLQVSPRSVATAVKVEREAPQEVIAAVTAGAMSLNLAAQVSELPEEEKAIVAAAPAEQIKEVAKEVVKAHVANNSGNNEWYTPSEYIEAARAVMGGIDTDPASSEIANTVVQASKFFTADDDGRNKEWSGNVWMNPPYAQPLISDFAEAIASKYESGEINQACVLVNNATETRWFQRIASVASAVCFPSGRIRFVDPEGKPSGAPLQGQSILYMGEQVDGFVTKFRDMGTVLIHV